MPTATLPTHLVVATDFSPSADQALRRADALAHHLGARVSLLHVIEPLPVVSAWGDPGAAAWIGLEALQEAGARALERQVAAHPDLRAGVSARHCLIGQPRRDLGALAAEIGGDLLVLGAHAPTGLGQRLLGSTAQAAVHGCPVPLLVCRRPATTAWHQVLAATDFSPSAEAAVALAEALAPEAGKRLLHAHPPLPEATLALMQPDPVQLERFVAEAERMASEHFAEACRRAPGWIGQFRRGEAPDLVVREATLHGADLVALGTRGHGRWLGGLLGSVGQKVLAALDADVLLVPAPRP
jgi:nucleotide-binding universal stress UspA family protein